MARNPSKPDGIEKVDKVQWSRYVLDASPHADAVLAHHHLDALNLLLAGSWLGPSAPDFTTQARELIDAGARIAPFDRAALWHRPPHETVFTPLALHETMEETAEPTFAHAVAREAKPLLVHPLPTVLRLGGAFGPGATAAVGVPIFEGLTVRAVATFVRASEPAFTEREARLLWLACLQVGRAMFMNSMTPASPVVPPATPNSAFTVPARPALHLVREQEANALPPELRTGADGVARHCVLAAMHATAAERASLVWRMRDRFYLHTAAGFPNTSVSAGTPVEAHNGVLAELFEEGHPMIVRDIAGLDAAQPNPDRGYRTRGFLAIPLYWRGAETGALCLTDKSGAGTFDTEDLRRILPLVKTIMDCMGGGVRADEDPTPQ